MIGVVVALISVFSAGEFILPEPYFTSYRNAAVYIVVVESASESLTGGVRAEMRVVDVLRGPSAKRLTYSQSHPVMVGSKSLVVAMGCNASGTDVVCKTIDPNIMIYEFTDLSGLIVPRGPGLLLRSKPKNYEFENCIESQCNVLSRFYYWPLSKVLNDLGIEPGTVSLKYFDEGLTRQGEAIREN